MSVGSPLGALLGVPDGISDGISKGSLVGCKVGAWEGRLLGARVSRNNSLVSVYSQVIDPSEHPN